MQPLAQAEGVPKVLPPPLYLLLLRQWDQGQRLQRLFLENGSEFLILELLRDLGGDGESSWGVRLGANSRVTPSLVASPTLKARAFTWGAHPPVNLEGEPQSHTRLPLWVI